MKFYFLLISLSFTLFALSGCSVTVPSVPVCVELSPDRGYCVNTISSENFYIDETRPYEGLSWWQMRPAMVHLPAQSWASIKTFVIQICTKTKKCDTELGGWERTVGEIDTMIKANK